MMASSSERWIDRLQFSSLFWTPPRDEQQRKVSQVSIPPSNFLEFIFRKLYLPCGWFYFCLDCFNVGKWLVLETCPF